MWNFVSQHSSPIHGNDSHIVQTTLRVQICWNSIFVYILCKMRAYLLKLTWCCIPFAYSLFLRWNDIRWWSDVERYIAKYGRKDSLLFNDNVSSSLIQQMIWIITKTVHRRSKLEVWVLHLMVIVSIQKSGTDCVSICCWLHFGICVMQQKPNWSFINDGFISFVIAITEVHLLLGTISY